MAPAALTRRPISPLENKENESLRLGGTRRIGSGRIMAARGFERDIRVDKERDRERERDFKDKRFRVLCKNTVYIMAAANSSSLKPSAQKYDILLFGFLHFY